MSDDAQVHGDNAEALFSLTIHRGEGMALLAMDWKQGEPPEDFVGFGIEYREPRSTRYYALKNRINFLDAQGKLQKDDVSTLLAPIQKFRWVHFPRNADMRGLFTYRVTPVFMNGHDELSYGVAQEASLELFAETVPGVLNLAFTRGYVSSQAFARKFAEHGPLNTIIADSADDGPTFVPTHPKAAEALEWMGFEARLTVLALLRQAVADGATVKVVAYDLNLPELADLLIALGPRLSIIIDDAGPHGGPHSAEKVYAQRLAAAGATVVRHKMGSLQHNKTIVVDGPTVKAVICGSTNFSWRGFFVQNNNALLLHGSRAVEVFSTAFDRYFPVRNGAAETDAAHWAKFKTTTSARWADLGLPGIDARVTFSPHSTNNAALQQIGADIDSASSSVLYSLAFLSQTGGAVTDALELATNRSELFVYGMSDKKTGFELQKPDGNRAPVYASALDKYAPAPFKLESAGGSGARIHHKFIVLDFNQPSARVYTGSYNMSGAADDKNGENLLLIRNRRIATAFMIEAIRMFDHYHFRVAMKEAKQKKTILHLKRPPRQPGEKPWWHASYHEPSKIRDRLLFR